MRLPTLPPETRTLARIRIFSSPKSIFACGTPVGSRAWRIQTDAAPPHMLLKRLRRKEPFSSASRRILRAVHNGNSAYQEAHMLISLNVFPGRSVFLTVILLSLLVVAPRVAAQTPSGSSQEQVKVLAHLPLEGMRVNQMFVQQRGNKSYLYLHRPTKDAFALVDVSKPDKPVLLSRDALKEAPGSQVEAPAGGSVLALTVISEGSAAQAAPAAVQLPTETVHFVDMSNPKSPKSVKSFKGVTSVYSDDARKLVYLVNADGLWIVSHHMTRPMPFCTSEDALNPVPECR